MWTVAHQEQMHPRGSADAVVALQYRTLSESCSPNGCGQATQAASVWSTGTAISDSDVGMRMLR